MPSLCFVLCNFLTSFWYVLRRARDTDDDDGYIDSEPPRKKSKTKNKNKGNGADTRRPLRQAPDRDTVCYQDNDFQMQTSSQSHSGSSRNDYREYTNTDSMGHHIQHAHTHTHHAPPTTSPPSLRDRNMVTHGNDRGHSSSSYSGGSGFSYGLSRVQQNTLNKLEKLADIERPPWSSSELIDLNDVLKVWDDFKFACRSAITFVDILDQTLTQLGQAKSAQLDREQMLNDQIQLLQRQLSSTHHAPFNAPHTPNRQYSWNSPHSPHIPHPHPPPPNPPRPITRTTSLFSDSNSHTHTVETSPSGPKFAHGTVMMDLNIIYYICAVDKDATADELIRAKS